VPETGRARRVKVQFYAEFRQAARLKEIELDIPEPLGVRELLTRITACVPALEGTIHQAVTQQEWGGHLLVLVDGRIVGLDTVVRPSERVQLVPPVSGG
jgi:molybdopterin converting factor small subunit